MFFTDPGLSFDLKPSNTNLFEKIDNSKIDNSNEHNHRFKKIMNNFINKFDYNYNYLTLPNENSHFIIGEQLLNFFKKI